MPRSRFHRTGFAHPWVLLLALACGHGCLKPRERAPLVSDGTETPEAEEPSLADDELIAVTDDGSEPCGETSIQLPIRRPTFYFALDASESMLEVMPASGGKTRYGAARLAIGDMLRVVGHRVRFGAAVFPAPDVPDACGAGAEVFAVRSGDKRAPDASANGPQIDALLFTLGKLRPNGATPVGATLQALKPSLESLGPKTYLFLLTDGAPNCDLSEGCTADRCIANLEGATLPDGRACDEELNCCRPELFPHLCLDGDGAAQSALALKEAGVRTYVIGIPGSETYAAVLDDVAKSAGTAREDAGTDYYPVGDVEQLASTLTEIGEELSLDCNFELEEEPERPGLVRVVADDERLEEGDANGWDWTSATSVALRGSACERWQRGDFDEVRILEGCDIDVR